MAKHSTPSEKLKIATYALEFSFRKTADKFGMSEAGVRRILKTQLRFIFKIQEIEKCNNTDDFRRKFKETHPIYSVKIITGFRKSTPEEIKKNIKALSRYKSTKEIAKSLNFIGLKNFSGGVWNSEDVRAAL